MMQKQMAVLEFEQQTAAPAERRLKALPPELPRVMHAGAACLGVMCEHYRLNDVRILSSLCQHTYVARCESFSSLF